MRLHISKLVVLMVLLVQLQYVANSFVQSVLMDKFGMNQLPTSFMLYSNLKETIVRHEKAAGQDANNVLIYDSSPAYSRSNSGLPPGEWQRPDEAYTSLFQYIRQNSYNVEVPFSWEDPLKPTPLSYKCLVQVAEQWMCSVLVNGFASYLDDTMSAEVLYGRFGTSEDSSQSALDKNWQHEVLQRAEKFHARVRIEMFMLTESDALDVAANYERLFAMCVVAPIVEMVKK